MTPQQQVFLAQRGGASPSYLFNEGNNHDVVDMKLHSVTGTCQLVDVLSNLLVLPQLVLAPSLKGIALDQMWSVGLDGVQGLIMLDLKNLKSTLPSLSSMLEIFGCSFQVFALL